MPSTLSKPHRRSIRLQGYDYSQAGLYFVTICCLDKVCRFGRVEDDVMILNTAGKFADACWLAIPEHFPNAILHEYVVMPNHVHGIIQLVGAENLLPLCNEFQKMIPRSIGSIIKGFKIGVTKWFRNANGVAENVLPLRSLQSVWQVNYYEHVIRNQESYLMISNYIINNPATWKNDKLFKV